MYAPGPEALLDRLEKIVADAPRVPLGKRALVDQEQVFALLDELRASLPREISEARALLRQRDQILDQARLEAEQLLEAAREEARAQAREHEIVKLASEKGKQVIAEAERAAREIMDESHRYAGEVLGQLENWLTRALETVRRGRQEVEARGREETGASSE
ncbi:MAG: ATPase [Bacillota bacterium]|nr:ATPase [Bacillota bacterium]